MRHGLKGWGMLTCGMLCVACGDSSTIATQDDAELLVLHVTEDLPTILAQAGAMGAAGATVACSEGGTATASGAALEFGGGSEDLDIRYDNCAERGVVLNGNISQRGASTEDVSLSGTLEATGQLVGVCELDFSGAFDPLGSALPDVEGTVCAFEAEDVLFGAIVRGAGGGSSATPSSGGTGGEANAGGTGGTDFGSGGDISTGGAGTTTGGTSGSGAASTPAGSATGGVSN